MRCWLITLLLVFAACSGSEELPPPEPECVYNSDCADTETCVAGQCITSAGCRNVADCDNLSYCQDDACFCQQGEVDYCRPFCVTDLECPADGHCLE